MARTVPQEPHVKPTHFFKIIPGHSLHRGKLMIPKTFVEKYGEGLQKTIFLEPPNGAKWKLNLVKRDGKIWFGKGWKEFAEYHSLASGHLLVFRYERTSHFHVHIFDMSALEINYPFKRVEGKRVSNGQGNKPPKNENSDDYRAGQKRKANLSLEFLQPSKMGSCKHVKDGNTLKLKKEALHHTDKKCKGKQIITARQVTTLDRASSFKTNNPSFLICMHPSYIDGRCYLNLPSKFAKRHFDLSKKWGDIHLRVLNGRVWPARYLIRQVQTRTRFELKGWKAFSKDNNLKAESLQIREACQGDKKEMRIITTTTKSSPPKSFNSII
ncbi:DNA-binding barrel domain superfamily [Sesbania bispinosa]|nr:DNA-binding barrel domain superfamily [Sesbania bispinosa]